MSNSHVAGTAPLQPCWLEVDLDAITQNVHALRRAMGPLTALAAVVKADAYGLGAVAVSRAALAAGAEWLAVARVEEGVALRRAGLSAPILNLAYTDPAEFELALEHRLVLTLADREGLAALLRVIGPARRVPVHLKVDTGLIRFGAQADELRPLLRDLARASNVRVEGVFSHFASADGADLDFAREQLRRFHETLALLEAHGLHPRLRHTANTAAAFALPEARFDLVRVGIGLYGPAGPIAPEPTSSLRPAFALRARLARLYDLPAGATVGYDQTYVCRRPTRAALVPVGYADGVSRAHSSRAEVLVRSQRAPLIGRVSMDQCVVDVTEISGTQRGDEVTLIGSQGEASIGATEFAAWSGTIVHEALCRIGPRVPRYYRQAGKLVSLAAPTIDELAGNGHASALLASSAG